MTGPDLRWLVRVSVRGFSEDPTAEGAPCVGLGVRGRTYGVNL